MAEETSQMSAQRIKLAMVPPVIPKQFLGVNLIFPLFFPGCVFFFIPLQPSGYGLSIAFTRAPRYPFKYFLTSEL